MGRGAARRAARSTRWRSIAEPDAAVAQAIDRPAAAPAADRLTEIVLTSPDPDDLTLRQLRALNQADTIYHAADVPAAILDRARRDAVRVVGAVPAVLPAGRSVAIALALGESSRVDP